MTFYSIALYLLTVLYLPKVIYQYLANGKYRSNFAYRFGLKIPSIERKKEKLFWIHAVSVGETKAVAPLVKRLKETFPDVEILISSGTETGFAEAQQSISCADLHIYLPIDFKRVMKKLVRNVKPNMVIFSETDLWYHFISYAKEQKALVALVNGKLSERSSRRLQKVPFYSKKLYGLIDLFCVQNEVYAERFQSIGVAPSKIHVTGNLKFDAHYPHLTEEELTAFRNELGIQKDDRVIVVGSSHHPEEKEILDQLLGYAKILIVPRHPERFEDVARLIESKKVPFCRYSQLESRPENPEVILIDAMGLLRKCYQIATVAIVAGSFVEHVGGHNITEPGAYKVPTVFGPYMHSQPELMDLVLSENAGIQTKMDALQVTVLKIFEDSALAAQLGDSAYALIQKNQGATAKTLEKIENSFLNAKSS